MYPGHPDELYARRVAEIADVGATHVALVVSWSQRDVTANGIAPRPEVTVPDRQLRFAAAAARDAGLEIVVFPILDVRARGPGIWRGTLRPRDADAWWRSYERFILHYAAIAAQEGATGLVVGSELGSTEAWRDRWYHLIGRVEQGFDGWLIYSANWDHYRHVSFWERVDAMGVSAYFELTDDHDASEAALAAAWRRERDALVAYARRVGKPLWLTEVGYPSMDGGAAQPWNYTRDADVDLEEQRRAYAALRAAWQDVPALAGLLIWNWWGDGGSDDRTYTPRGKPAERVLRQWFRGN